MLQSIKTMYILGFLFLIVCCVNCIGDSACRVKGKIVAISSADQCSIMLNNAEGAVVGTHNIMSDFQETFIIAPKIDDYYFTIRCEGNDNIFKSQIYELGDIEYYKKPIDLGEIDIK